MRALRLLVCALLPLLCLPQTSHGDWGGNSAVAGSSELERPGRMKRGFEEHRSVHTLHCGTSRSQPSTAAVAVLFLPLPYIFTATLSSAC
ncbi:hypothetical protein AOLI_G00178360 [Acnodon oligacanthus]